MKAGTINGDYGEVRVATHKGRIFFSGSDVAKLLSMKPFYYYERQIPSKQKIKAPYKNVQGKLAGQYLVMIDEEGLYGLIEKSVAPDKTDIYKWLLDKGNAFLNRQPKILYRGETSSEIFGNDVGRYYELGCFDGDEFRRINTIWASGQTLYVAKDIVESLGFDKVTSALRNHLPSREACRIKIKDSSKQYTFTTDGDFMRAIVAAAKQSKRPSIRKKCKIVEEWIYDKIMRGIMQDGGYIYNLDKFMERKLHHLTPEEKDSVRELLAAAESAEIETPIEQQLSLFHEELAEKDEEW